jgi:hypothetical protein
VLVSLLSFSLSSDLLLLELLVSGVLFLHNLPLHLVCLLLLPLLEKMAVLHLQFFIHFVFLLVTPHLLTLLLQLLVQFLLDKSLPFSFPHHSLLLFFIMEEGVKLLNGCPLVLLINFRVQFCAGSLRGGNTHAVIIGPT